MKLLHVKLLYVSLLLLLAPSAWATPVASALINSEVLMIADASISLDSAIRNVQQRYPGKVIGAHLDEGQGVYKIKIVSADGRVQVLLVDRQSGQIVGEGG
jgi:uncharacterized membrane protein YkoI